jgi:hypothetical protein
MPQLPGDPSRRDLEWRKGEVMTMTSRFVGRKGCTWRARASADAVAAWEARWSTPLPALYRELLLEAGDGGVAYGQQVYSLEAATQLALEESQYAADDAGEWVEEQGSDAGSAQWSPALPFPVGAGSEPHHSFATAAFIPYPAPGALPLVDMGCGMTDVLVVAGPRAGEVWSLSRDDGGMYWKRAANLEEYFDWLAKVRSLATNAR